MVSNAEKFNRYLIIEEYFGKFNDIKTVCACYDVKTAKELVSLLEVKYKDRPFRVYFKKIADDFIDFLDDENYSIFG